MATLMGNRAVDPKVLARTLHAWESAFERHRKAGHPVREEDVETARKLIRRAEKVLRKCVYEKKRTLVRKEAVQFNCLRCKKPLDLAEFNDTVARKRVPEPRCRVCTKLLAHAAREAEPPAAPATPAPTQAQQERQAAPDPTASVS